MSGSQEGARKRVEKWRKNPSKLARRMSAVAKKQRGGGFGSDTVGSDGLTGKERAKIAGKKARQAQQKEDNDEVSEI